MTTTTEAQNSPSDQNPITNSNQTTEPKLMFTFDGPVAQSYINQNDKPRVPSRLTSSSAEGDGAGDGASESCDGDKRSCVLNSYIEGVSLNSR